MTEEYIMDRERDLLDFFRNNLDDPEDRGNAVEQTFIAVEGQTEFQLSNSLVKNVADTIKINDVLHYKGYHYKVEYGEGKRPSTVTINTPLEEDDEVKIMYSYGEAMVEREYSRSDAKLPRVILMFLTGSAVYGALGDNFEDGKGTYLPVAVQIEVRDRFANRARKIASQAFNLGLKMRHADLFRTNIVNPEDLQNMDYDIEKECYIWTFTLSVEWELIFDEH